MRSILTSIYCIPCVWSILALLAVFGLVSFVMNAWVPFRGPLPSDGPTEGFASKSSRIEFYDTTPLRIRTAVKYGVIGGVVWMTGLITSYLILNSMSGGV